MGVKHWSAEHASIVCCEEGFWFGLKSCAGVDGCSLAVGSRSPTPPNVSSFCRQPEGTAISIHGFGPSGTEIASLQRVHVCLDISRTIRWDVGVKQINSQRFLFVLQLLRMVQQGCPTCSSRI